MTELVEGSDPVDPVVETKDAWAERVGDRMNGRTLA